MSDFQDYLQSIKTGVFDYLCDTLYDIGSYPIENFTAYLTNDNELFQNNTKLFNCYKRVRFYEENNILLYYGCQTIPQEYRERFIIELQKVLCGDNKYYDNLVKNDCEEGTYDDRILIHFCKKYALYYISLRDFQKYYHEKLSQQILK